MSFGITVQGDLCGGAQLAGGQSTLIIEGRPVVVLGDPIKSHGDSPHSSAKMVEASSWMTWNGVPVVREGNKASCGHVTQGQSTFTIPG